MRFDMGSNESCACGARPLQVAGRKAGIDEPYEWKSSRTGLWGASGASPAPTRHILRKFQAAPAQGQRLTPPILIQRAIRLD